MEEELNYGKFSIQIDIPEYKEPTDYYYGIIKWGSNNLYPLYLESLLAKSPLHSQIIERKARMIGGYGFLKNNINQFTQLFLRNPHSPKESMDKILTRISYDLVVYGSFTLKIVWSKDRKRISKICYVPRENVRIKPNCDEDEIYGFEVCKNWSNTRKFPIETYVGFSETNRTEAEQIMLVKDFRKGDGWNGQPDYLSVVNYIEAQYAISEFHLSNIEQGFSAPIHIDTKLNNPSIEQKQQIVNGYKRQFESQKGMKVIYTFSPIGGEITTINNIDIAATHEQFLLLNETIEKAIIYAHGVPPVMFIETPGKLGSRNELLEATEIFQVNYIEKYQKLIEDEFNMLLRLSFPDQVVDELIIKRYSQNYVSVNTNISEVLSILESTITPEQKYLILVQNSYEEDIAKELSGLNQKNNLQ